VSFLLRLFKVAASVLGVLVAQVLLVAAAGFVYVEVESKAEVALPEPTGPYAVGRASYDWVDPSPRGVLHEGEG
jgi:hypothetical protein